jgi:transcriptional regulator with XRE-family HTH domain
MNAPMMTKEDARDFISHNVCRLMSETGLSQRELSRLSGMDQARISLLVRGLILPNPADLANLAEALGTTTDGLLRPVPVNA